MLILSIVSFLVLMTFYLFYRSEVLKKEIKGYKTRLANANNSGKLQSEMIVLLANSQAALLKTKLNILKNQVDESSDLLRLVDAMIAQYSNIVTDIAFKHDTVHKSVERNMERQLGLTGDEIKKIIMLQGNAVKRSWNDNNLNGFIRLCELLVEPALPND